MVRKNDPELVLEAPAKINLWLHIVGKRDDGYHELRTVMQAVTILDELRFWRRDDGEVVLDAKGEGLPHDQENLVVKAACKLQEETGTDFGVTVELTKSIPVGRGLGGGSSDCAATLKALNELWELELSRKQICMLAADLGSDVPFFLWSGTALCEGRGEEVEPISIDGVVNYVIIVPAVSISTKDVYEAYSAGLTRPVPTGTITAMLHALEECDAVEIGRNLRNDLTHPALQVCPELARIRHEISRMQKTQSSTGFGLTGSGSSFFTVHTDGREAREMACRIEEQLGVTAMAVTNYWL